MIKTEAKKKKLFMIHNYLAFLTLKLHIDKIMDFYSVNSAFYFLISLKLVKPIKCYDDLLITFYLLKIAFQL
jgi:hypothetical protein